jgi:hypothetical protein
MEEMMSRPKQITASKSDALNRIILPAGAAHSVLSNYSARLKALREEIVIAQTIRRTSLLSTAGCIAFTAM